VDYASKDDYGLVDLKEALKAHAEVVAYLAAEFLSESAREVDVGGNPGRGWAVGASSVYGVIWRPCQGARSRYGRRLLLPAPTQTLS
jgi:type IV secretory pathway TrbL component